jgi:hypothetical protein
MAINPMQQQQSPDMLMAMMTDPRATPQQRMAAMSALNALKGGANAPQQPPQMTGDSTGVSQMDPGFMAAVRQEMLGQGPEEQPEIPQRQAAPEAPQDSSTAALMSGAADASRVAAMAQGGAVKGYADGESVLQKTVRNARSANRGDYSFLGGRGYPRTDILSERLRGLVSPEMTQEEAIEKFYTEGGGRNNPQLIKDVFSNLPDVSPERLAGKLGSAIGKGVDYLYEKAEPYARKAIDYSTGSELTQDPDFVAEEIRKKRMGDSAPGEERYQLESLKDFKPTLQEFPINENAAEFAAPDGAIAAPRAKAAKRAAQALTTPPPAAVEPGKPDAAAEAMNARKQSESDAYKERMDKLLSDDQPLSAQDKWMALARAGFASAAGSSPYALQNIGAGLSKGVESLDELRKERAVNRMKQATLLQSQRSEELTSEDRKTTAGIQQQLANIQRGKLDLEKDPNSLENKVRAAQVGYYGRAGTKEPSIFAERRAAQQEVDAMPEGAAKKAAQESLDRVNSPEKNTNDFTIKNAILNAGIKAGEAFDKGLSDLDKIQTDPVKKAATAKLRQDAVNEAKRSAAEYFNVDASKTAAPPPAGGRVKFDDLP